MSSNDLKLMPFQDSAFNGDKFIEQEFLKLKHKFDIINAVETGTCLGSTTLFLSNNFQNVYTVEINPEYLHIAKQKFISRKNITTYQGDSVKLLNHIIEGLEGETIFFLDAHWEKQCPLLDELASISAAGIRPIIAIHDFHVPRSGLGFDSYNGQPFNFSWLRNSLYQIYGQDYEYYYNSDELSGGAKRGIIYITPL